MPHPYWYARVMGIFHANVLWRGDNSPSKRVDFLWVRWFGRDLDLRAGWKSRRLHRVGFVSSLESAAYGFLDPALVIRGVHLIPAFDIGRTSAYLTAPIIRPPKEKDAEWRQYYVNMFSDRDMFMRFRGGGVGHKSAREATDQFLQDRHPSDEHNATTHIEDENGDNVDGEVMGQTDEGVYGDSDLGEEHENENEAENEQPELEEELEDSLGPEDGEDQDDDDDGDNGYGAL